LTLGFVKGTNGYVKKAYMKSEVMHTKVG